VPLNQKLAHGFDKMPITVNASGKTTEIYREVFQMENKTEKDVLCAALEMMALSTITAYNAWLMVRGEDLESDLAYDIDDIIEDGYPFHESFADMAIDVAEWASKAVDAIRNL